MVAVTSLILIKCACVTIAASARVTVVHYLPLCVVIATNSVAKIVFATRRLLKDGAVASVTVVSRYVPIV